MTTAQELGTIEKVDIKAVWPAEDVDFTPWLGENLDKLGAELGLDLELVETEAHVGTFKLDVRAHDANTNGEVVIENQFGQTDHSHLGQLLTYASGFDAQAIVWIAEHFRDEHREALDYLNHRTGEDTQFFGVEVELWRIGNSIPAPHFNAVVIPNEWRKQTVSAVKPGTGNVSDRRAKYRLFFQKLIDVLREEHKFTGARAAQPNSWYQFSAGHAQRVRYSASFPSGARCRIELYIDNGNKEWNENLFDDLEEYRTEIETALGETLQWERLDNRRACRISAVRQGSIDDDDETLEDIREWMVEWLLKFKEVFGPRLADLVD